MLKIKWFIKLIGTGTPLFQAAVLVSGWMDSSTKNLKKCDSTKPKDMNSGTMVAMEQGKNNENKGNDIIK